MAHHSNIPAWRIPWTEEPGTTVHGVAKSQTRLSDQHLTYGTSLVVQWLRRHTSMSGAAGSIPVQGTRILHTLLHSHTCPPLKKCVIETLSTLKWCIVSWILLFVNEKTKKKPSYTASVMDMELLFHYSKKGKRGSYKLHIIIKLKYRKI